MEKVKAELSYTDNNEEREIYRTREPTKDIQHENNQCTKGHKNASKAETLPRE